MNTEDNFIMNLSDLKSFNYPKDKLFSLQINHAQVKYEFLVRLASNNKNLICFGSGAHAPDKMSPPIFRRLTWQDEFEESVIYYNDPTLYLPVKSPLRYDVKRLSLGWGVGTPDNWYLLTILDIIKILALKNRINPEDILFFGSSCGGFTSLILSTLMKKSQAIINNPQIFCKALEGHLENVLNVCFDKLDYDTALKEYGCRLDVFELFKHEKYIPNFTYVINVNSEIDFHRNLLPFLDRLNKSEYFHDQIQIILYSSENGHDGVLDKEKTVKLIKNHFNLQNECLTQNKNVIETYETTIKSLEDDLNDINMQLKIIAKTKSFRIAYLLHRIHNQFIKGNNKDKKEFLDWMYNKFTKKNSKQPTKYNPLNNLIK
ncbi:hypothetical protein Metbo_0913 [Methanobacterium lacus]|uniref:Uncharacterized protein n=1 Tax=Methanobacterium lacus (strain AL-21) TaxID=877455 RepID=F0TC11_METLA|nr:hypothetical protein [Methanobacterium lacus]ADZ09162.1 hypothetical protein Metbo_0913 [Methanobacterium lacus]